MRTGTFARLLGTTAMLLVAGTLGCGEKKDVGAAAPSAPPAASAAAAREPKEPPPGRCTASGAQPTKLVELVGDVYGFAGTATHLYYTSWDVYGSHGRLGAIRKDAQGATTVVSLTLEPRGLVVAGTHALFTSGIRLMSVPVEGGEMTTPAPQFSAQAIALYKDEIYGVPADYGPYDRVAKIGKGGGETKELATDKRSPGTPPNGYSAIAVDESGIYVTDSGRNRLLRFPLEGGKPKALASGQPKPFALAVSPSSVYFTLAKKGDLLAIAKAGGAPRKLAGGLVPESRIAADDSAVYATLAGKTDQDPLQIVKIPAEGGEPTTIAEVPSANAVQAILLDGDCVYWADRRTATSTVVYAHAR